MTEAELLDDAAQLAAKSEQLGSRIVKLGSQIVKLENDVEQLQSGMQARLDKMAQDTAACMERIACVVCKEQPRSTLYFPCRHVACCSSCVFTATRACPVCRTPIRGYIKVHM